MNKNHIIIVGGGISGLTSAIYLLRAGNEVIVFKNYSNGNLENTPKIENYPGTSGSISGVELLQNIENQVIDLGGKIYEEKIDEINTYFNMVLSDCGKTYSYDALIVATGVKVRQMSFESNIQGCNNNIHYCAMCDGAFYKDKSIIVIGGGNTSVTNAIYLSSICKEVKIMVRKNIFKANKILLDKLLSLNNIRVMLNTEIKTVFYDDNKKMKFIMTNTNEKIDSNGIFVCIGNDKNDELLKNSFGNEWEEKFIENHFENIFICGSIKGKEYDQAIISAGDGASCAIQVDNFLKII